MMRSLLHALAFLFLLALGGCHSPQRNQPPSIEFTKIPPAAQGGRERMDTIAGRVVGAKPGQQIVIFAKSGPWWVQPWPDQALIPVQSDSTWSASIHLGYEYAAMLVDPGYHPPPTMDQAPTQGGAVVLVNIVKGVGTLPPHPTTPLSFSGYDWKVQMVSATRGGLNNLYDADNVWTDSGGAMHLRIIKKEKGWTCAHVILGRNLGYGTYRFVVHDTSRLEPAAVLSMHTFDEAGAEQHYREMDVEVSHWGDPAAKTNAQYGLQPFYVPGNVAQFSEPTGMMTHTMVWQPGQVSFKSVRGSFPKPDAPPVYEHVFTSGVPIPGTEFLEFMFYFVASEKHPLQNGSEVVIDKFEYLP